MSKTANQLANQEPAEVVRQAVAQILAKFPMPGVDPNRAFVFEIDGDQVRVPRKR